MNAWRAVFLVGVFAGVGVLAGSTASRPDAGASSQPAPAGDRLVLVSPAQNDSWSVGSLHRVTWKSPAGASAVRVEYTVDGGRRWVTAIHATDARPAERVPCSGDGSGALLWKVPPAAGRRCTLRIRDVAGAAGSEERTFAVVPSQERTDYHWKQMTAKADFAARDGAGALVSNGRMWLLGGWNPGDRTHFPTHCNSEVWSSFDGRAWTLVNPQAPWEARHTAGYVVHRGQLWIVGGDAIQRHYQNDVWRSPDGLRWERVTDGVPWGPRVLHYTVAFDDRIWVMGGQTLPQFAPEAEVFYNDVWSTKDGQTWTRVAEHAPWTPRGMIGGSVVFKGRIWLLGGGTYDTPKSPRRFYNDVWSTSDGVRWERHVESAPWTARQYHDVAVFDNRMWVLEGWNQSNRSDVWYSSDGVNWYELPGTPWAPRHAASVFVHDDALWMVAGNNMTPDVWRLTREGSAARE